MVKESRNITIDVTKGFLIFLVVLGHTLRGNLQDNALRYVIYSFHMPAFFFISGYLIQIENLEKLSFSGLLAKYWKRMLKIWVLAFILYSAYALRDIFNLKSILYLCIHPYYHLWFVPSLFVMICIVWLLFNYSRDIHLNFCILVGGGILLYNWSSSEFYFDTYLNCQFLIFFVLGILSKKMRIDMSKTGMIWLVVVYLLITLVSWYMSEGYDFFNKDFKLPLVGLLCLLFFAPLMKNGNLRCDVLECWGRNSLSIYLWHVFPIIALKSFFSDIVTYYIITSLLLGVCIVVTYSHVNKVLPCK